MAERICVAQIGAPHGIRGEVRLRSFTQEPMAVASYGPLETEDGAQSFTIEALRAAKDHLVAKLNGVSDREAAEALTNLRLFVPRERLPANEEPDTYYHADLIGLSVVTKDGSELGTVVALHDFGAGDLIEVRPKTGASTVLLPFNDTVVPQVDIAGGRIVVDPPKGTFSGAAYSDSPPPLRGRSAPKAPGGG